MIMIIVDHHDDGHHYHHHHHHYHHCHHHHHHPLPVSKLSICGTSWKVDTWEETWKAAVRGEREKSLQRSLINFHFHPGHPKALKLSPQTCGRLESHIKTAEERFWNIVYCIFVCFGTGEEHFLDLVLLHFTPQLLPTLSIDLLDGQLLILC